MDQPPAGRPGVEKCEPLAGAAAALRARPPALPETVGRHRPGHRHDPVARPQPPNEILAATSSASFIKEENLLRLVSLMGQPGADLLQVELFTPAKPRNMH